MTVKRPDAAPAGEVPTRTRDTEHRYREFVDRMLLEASGGRGVEVWLDEASDDEVLEWAKARRRDLKRSAWRWYRAAIAFRLDELGRAEVATRVRGIRQTRENETRRIRTGARKMKGGADPLGALVRVLTESGDANSDAAATLLGATVMLGLRPCEWASVEVIEDGEALCVRVRNAKHTNGRAHGTHRHLHVVKHQEVVASAVAAVRDDIAHAKSRGQNWTQRYNVLRSLLLRTAKRALPGLRKGPAFYSARHQFVANGKAAGCGLMELAALMGHAVDDTASEHYGRRVQGNAGRWFVQADSKEVERVRSVYSAGPMTPIPNLVRDPDSEPDPDPEAGKGGGVT